MSRKQKSGGVFDRGNDAPNIEYVCLEAAHD